MNVFLFTHDFLDINVSMYTKSCICNNVMMQIQVQIGKITLEVAHMQEFHNHDRNVPYMVTRVLLDLVSTHHTLCCSHQ